MPITYTIDRDKNLVFETWTGEVRAADLAAYWRQLLGDPEAMQIRRTVVDLRTAVICFSGLDFDSLIQEVAVPLLNGQKWTTAIVVAAQSQFGVSRQYQVFAQRYSTDSIFDSIPEAEKWIASIAS